MLYRFHLPPFEEGKKWKEEEEDCYIDDLVNITESSNSLHLKS